MSLASLMNHICTVHRAAETTDEYGDVVGPFASVGTERLAMSPPKGGMINYGPGMQEAGVLAGAMRPAADVKRLDIIDVTSGPEAPSKWRVTAVAHPRGHHTHPRGHHTELVLEPYTGDIA